MICQLAPNQLIWVKTFQNRSAKLDPWFSTTIFRLLLVQAAAATVVLGRGAKMPSKHISVHHLFLSYYYWDLMLWVILACLRGARAVEELAELLVVCLCPGCNSTSPCEGLRDSSSCYTARLDEKRLPLCLAACFLCTPRCFFSLEAWSRHNAAPRFLKKRLELWVRTLHCERPSGQAERLEPIDGGCVVCVYLHMTKYSELTM